MYSGIQLTERKSAIIDRSGRAYWSAIGFAGAVGNRKTFRSTDITPFFQSFSLTGYLREAKLSRRESQHACGMWVTLVEWGHII